MYEKEPNVMKQTSALIPYPIWELAKINLIEIREALIFGIQFLVAEKDNADYPNCRLLQKMEGVVDKLSQVTQELNALKEEKAKEAMKEVDQYFKDIPKAKEKREDDN